MRRLRRIREEVNSMPPRESKRVIYAKSEFYIVAATYFYYVGLDEPMFQELNRLDPMQAGTGFGTISQLSVII